VPLGLIAEDAADPALLIAELAADAAELSALLCWLTAEPREELKDERD